MDTLVGGIILVDTGRSRTEGLEYLSDKLQNWLD